jgi:CBS domain-containing protein
MIASSLIKERTKYPDLQSGLLEVLTDFLHWDFIPVTENDHYLGSVKKTIIELALDDGLNFISEVKQEIITGPNVHENCHFFEITKIFSRSKTPIIAVTNDEGLFLGVITKADLLDYYSSLYTISQAGSVIVIEIEPQNLLLSHLIRVIENNDVKVLGVEISEQENSQKIWVQIKLNTAIIKNVLSSIERHDYFVSAHFMRQDIDSEDDEMRYKLLMNYLDLE